MRATILPLLAAIGLVVLGAAPASAGGPTSVLLSSPENQRVAAVYHSDSAYKRLESAVHGGQAVKATESDSYVTATWLIHDVQVWRTDRIFLTASGPVIETRIVGPEGGNIWDAPATWHSSPAPAELAALFDTLGLTKPGQVVDIPAVAAPALAAVETTVAPGDVRWEWGIGGLVVGALVTFAAFRVRRARLIGV
ncbi:hypothetical protein [Actinokineospora sp. HUAS TT18]|uniref:hypothetical protein n=1 Tax=Actinokineospora sp. HUAS TT18 TaxID=3447451 RepID=UPI003F51BD50